jgi:hypothetical protein
LEEAVAQVRADQEVRVQPVIPEFDGVHFLRNRQLLVEICWMLAASLEATS